MKTPEERMDKPRIGWVGAGAMGAPMCMNLLAAGYALTICEKRPARREELAAAGADMADSAAELGTRCDVVFSTVFDDDDLLAVTLGQGGIAASSPRRVHTYVDMSTVSPVASAAVAVGLEGKLRYLRAPVSGTVSLAESAQLGVYASGPMAAFDEIRPILSCISARQTHVGAGEEARVLKLMINLLVFTSTAALGEVLSLGRRSGLNRSTMIDAINESIAGSSHYRAKADKLRRRDYTAAGPISLVAKDLDLALQVATHAGSPVSIAALVRQQLHALQGCGLSNCDVAVLAEVPELATGDVSPITLGAVASR